MTLIPWMPFKDVSQWRDEMERFWQNALANSPFNQNNIGPRIEIYQTENEVVARAEVPGIENTEDLQVSATRDTLTIKGEVKRGNEVRQENYYRAERYYGNFARTIPLPAQVKWEKARATYRNGILEVRIPKAEQAYQANIPINLQ